MSAQMLITSTIHFDTLWIHNNANFEHYLRYILIFLIGFFPLNFIVSKSNFIKRDNFIAKNFQLRTLFFILYSPAILLFIYGYDWGRWINITYTFSILFYVFLIKNSIIEHNLKIENSTFKKILKKKYLVACIFILFAFSWNPKTVITGDIAGNTGYKIIYNTSKKIFNFGSIRLFQDNLLIEWNKKIFE